MTPPDAGVEPPHGDRPRVVLVRPTDLANDSRAKKIALSLERLGYDVTLLGRSDTAHRRHGSIGAATVLLVPPKSRLRGTPRRSVRLPSRRARGVEQRANRALQALERAGDKRLRQWNSNGRYLFHAAQRDFRTTYGGELVALAPHVIHVHDPRLLPTAFRAAQRISTRHGRPCEVVYDSRENFAGVLETAQSLPAYHRQVLATEARYAPRTAAVLTVSDVIADALSERMPLPARPFVLLNSPVLRDKVVDDGRPLRSLREDTGLTNGETILVYPGAASKARGVDTIVEALPLMPDVHAAFVVVPFPHPREDEMRERAAAIGVADRIHFVPPVEADDVPRYLAEADLAIHPMLGGIPNHEMALPNKLFEVLHARLPMVSSSVRTMAAFVREHNLGPVFTAGDPTDLARAVNDVIRSPQSFASEPERAALSRIHSWQAQEHVLATAYARAAPPEPREAESDFPPVVVSWS